MTTMLPETNSCDFFWEGVPNVAVGCCWSAHTSLFPGPNELYYCVEFMMCCGQNSKHVPNCIAFFILGSSGETEHAMSQFERRQCKSRIYGIAAIVNHVLIFSV